MARNEANSALANQITIGLLKTSLKLCRLIDWDSSGVASFLAMTINYKDKTKQN